MFRLNHCSAKQTGTLGCPAHHCCTGSTQQSSLCQGNEHFAEATGLEWVLEKKELMHTHTHTEVYGIRSYRKEIQPAEKICLKESGSYNPPLRAFFEWSQIREV